MNSNLFFHIFDTKLKRSLRKRWNQNIQIKKIFVIALLSTLTVYFNYTYSQTIYKIPGATKQPAWVFPIWFEDGNGDRDTVYFCYDSLADDYFPSEDTIFGEKILYKDTSKFWVGIWTLPWYDSTSVVYVNNDPGTGILFNKGKYPLKISWDDTLFYSGSLPFPDLSPKPRARITIWCSDFFHNCPWDYPVTITGYSPDTIPGQPFFMPFKDSIVFYSNTNYTIQQTLSNFTLELKPYNAPTETGIKPTAKHTLEIYPNPVRNIIYVKNVFKHASYQIFNNTGQVIKTGKLTYINEQITIHDLLPGLYILQIFTPNNNYIHKFLIF